MTPLLKVMTEYCGIFVDDIRLGKLLETDLPLYARRMWGYLQPAIGLFNVPVEMQGYLVGTPEAPNLIPPAFATREKVVNESSAVTAAYNVWLSSLEPPEELYGLYDFCTCKMRTKDAEGNIVVTPREMIWQSTEAIATVEASPENPIPVGAVLEFDLYSDGHFVKDLTIEQMSILGKCFNVVWQTRFLNDWLSMVPKTGSKSFPEQNRAKKEDSDTARLEALRRDLAGEMRRYEQNLYYKQVITSPQRLKI